MNQTKIRETLRQSRTDTRAVANLAEVSERTVQRLRDDDDWRPLPSTLKLVAMALEALYPPKPRGTK